MPYLVACELGGIVLGSESFVSSLSSLSTRAQVLSAYADNASYEEDASEGKAKAFITACRLLLSPKFSAARAAHEGDEVQLDLSLIRSELEATQAWLTGGSARVPAGATTHTSFQKLRD